MRKKQNKINAAVVGLALLCAANADAGEKKLIEAFKEFNKKATEEVYEIKEEEKSPQQVFFEYHTAQELMLDTRTYDPRAREEAAKKIIEEAAPSALFTGIFGKKGENNFVNTYGAKIENLKNKYFTLWLDGKKPEIVRPEEMSGLESVIDAPQRNRGGRPKIGVEPRLNSELIRIQPSINVGKQRIYGELSLEHQGINIGFHEINLPACKNEWINLSVYRESRNNREDRGIYLSAHFELDW